MLREPALQHKKILVLDKSPKTDNDRTWCFWEKAAGLFEPIVHHRWSRLGFYSPQYAASLDISPYQYKMIRGIDLYRYTQEQTAAFPGVVWQYASVQDIRQGADRAEVITSQQIFTTDYVFNSIPFRQPEPRRHHYRLIQHFRGWLIRTETPCFNPGMAVFMDFRISQQYGTTFVYCLPVSEQEALVEYTLFSENLLPDAAYEEALRKYIAAIPGIGQYTIVHREKGAIPMTNARYALREGRIVHMGTAGGQVKGSSGYAFQFIQKRTAAIVQSLVQNGHPYAEKKIFPGRFHWYDSILLRVLQMHQMDPAALFTGIFRHNPPTRVLRFLDNETSLVDDLRIMQSVPMRVFLPAALAELFL